MSDLRSFGANTLSLAMVLKLVLKPLISVVSTRIIVVTVVLSPPFERSILTNLAHNILNETEQ